MDMPLCACGCGQPVTLAKRTYNRKGIKAGQPLTYVRYHHATAGRTAKKIWTPALWVVEDRGYLTPCWIWLGPFDQDGYGLFGGRARSHRFAYEWNIGAIPDGLTIDHHCVQPACVNHDHLEPVTAGENLRRRHARKRGHVVVRRG